MGLLVQIWPWALATSIAASLAIAGRTRGPIWLHYLFKPAMLLALLAMAFTLPSALPPAARPWLFAALALAWAGDVALMFGTRGFIIGLISFLLAHVAYLVCFSLELTWTWGQLVSLALVLPFSCLGVRGALPHVGRLKPAVITYACVLTLVAWRLLARIERADQLGLTSCLLGIAGGALFVLADSLLVRRRFAAAKIPYWLELGSYAASQLCIVASTLALVAT